MEVLSRTSDWRWFLVRLSSGDMAWVPATHISIDAQVAVPEGLLPDTFSIRGTVRAGSAEGWPIPDVIISTDQGHGATTDAGGTYTVTNLITGTYTLTPAKIGYTFSPSWLAVTVSPDVTGLDFVGTGRQAALFWAREPRATDVPWVTVAFAAVTVVAIIWLLIRAVLEKHLAPPLLLGLASGLIAIATELGYLYFYVAVLQAGDRVAGMFMGCTVLPVALILHFIGLVVGMMGLNTDARSPSAVLGMALNLLGPATVYVSLFLL